jgi:FtsP/CotA-like multicopper oxidase with cupredoxin domain
LIAVPAFAACPDRPFPGETVADPVSISSQGGVLDVALGFQDGKDRGDNTIYCFTYQTTEAPTLRVNPGDRIRLSLQNLAQDLGSQASPHTHRSPTVDPCMGVMTSLSTNVHFHGLNVFSTCHADEVIHTLINPGDPPFQYDLRVPANEPPGLYWYHPHPHSLTGIQILGGASGALIVEGIEKIKPEVAGLPERVLIVRQQANPSGDIDSGSLTLNFIPATFPETLSPLITTKPQEKQFWRVLNAAGATFLNLQVQINGDPENLKLIAVDGTPLKADQVVKTIRVPPAGRVEFIMQTPKVTDFATFSTIGEDTGIDGDPNPPQQLAKIVATSDASAHAVVPRSQDKLGPRRFADLQSQTPRTVRHLYFSEDLTDPDNPLFFITVQGQTPKIYDPDDPPAIVTQQGAVEDWVIQNQSREIHAFHMHQLHFLVLERNGVRLQKPTVQDTVTVPAWDGVSAQRPSVKVRMDFRFKESVGTFLYHCHILDHEDGGMMAKIEVDPAN